MNFTKFMQSKQIGSHGFNLADNCHMFVMWVVLSEIDVFTRVLIVCIDFSYFKGVYWKSDALRSM